MYRCYNCNAVFREPVVREYTQTSEHFGFPATEKMRDLFCPECGEECVEEFDDLRDQYADC